MRCRIAVLISDKGTGTNLQAIIDRVKSGKIKAEIAAVISDTPKAPGLAKAAKHKLPIKIVPKKAKLLEVLKKLNLDYICLAGWKQIILDEIIKAFPNKILNLHPGLIPENMKEQVLNPDGSKGLWNRGKLTDQAVQVFLDAKSTYAGSSIHFLSAEFDFGPVLGRCFEKIKKGDTTKSLYARLKKKENKLYVDVLARLCTNYSNNWYKTILITDGGGRGAALLDKYARSKKAGRILVVPGNDLMAINTKKEVKIFPHLKPTSVKEILEICKTEKVDLVDVAQDDVIAAGFVDRLESLGIAAFGPTQKASQLEWDKEWARNFMVKYDLPIPRFKSFNNTKAAISYVNLLPHQVLYIKATGLALGKGVIRTNNKQEAVEAIYAMSKFGKSGETFLIEEALAGEEFSLFAICDGEDFVIARSAQDHKTIYDGDKGPNTGGVGSVAPTGAVNETTIRNIATKIIKPVLEGMRKEGRPYKGILYLGGMLTKEGVKIIEFNSRWGDPEAEVILPGLKTDYLDIVEAVRLQRLKKIKIVFDDKIRLSIAGCAKGYPGDYSKVLGKQIFGLEKTMKQEGVTIFGAGIKGEDNRFYVQGGRIFHLVAEGKDILEARERAYKAIKLISVEGDNLHYRTDIGWRDVERLIQN